MDIEDYLLIFDFILWSVYTVLAKLSLLGRAARRNSSPSTMRMSEKKAISYSGQCMIAYPGGKVLGEAVRIKTVLYFVQTWSVLCSTMEET